MDEARNDELKKKVDETWKESVSKEKSSDEPAHDKLPEEVTFGLFAYGLMVEALIALGDAENPVTKKKETNAAHAKFVIDAIAMLQEKTKGNLSKDEEEMLQAMLYDLRMRFVNKVSKTPPAT